MLSYYLKLEGSKSVGSVVCWLSTRRLNTHLYLSSKHPLPVSVVSGGRDRGRGKHTLVPQKQTYTSRTIVCLPSPPQDSRQQTEAEAKLQNSESLCSKISVRSTDFPLVHFKILHVEHMYYLVIVIFIDSKCEVVQRIQIQ